SVSVAPIYSAPEITPPQATAPGSVFCGSRISSPITEASSSPTNPKQITPNEFRTNFGSAGNLKSAVVTGVPNRAQTVRPSAMRTAAATNVPMPPILFSHLPTPRPITFRAVSNANNATDATMAKVLSSANAALLGPIANTETPTKYSITV